MDTNTNAKKKKIKGEEVRAAAEPTSEESGSGIEPITNRADLKKFLTHVQDKMMNDAAPPLYVMSALNYVLNHPNVYELMDQECREIARELWLRLKKSGLQLRNPPLLFPEDGKNGVSV